MVDEFYLDVNLELFVQWLFGNKNKYDHNILCTLKSNEPYGKTITLIIIILVVQLLFGLMVSLKNKSLMMKKIYYSIFITNSLV